MSGRSNAASALQNSTGGEAPFREFVRSNLTPEQSKQRAALLLDRKDVLRNVQGLAPEDQTIFIDKVDEVRRSWLTHLSQCLFLILPTKTYPAVDLRTVKFINALGEACSATVRLPTSTLLAAGLEKRGSIAVASGGLTDIWRGEYYGSQVAIKAFRIYPTRCLKEAKEVSAWLLLETY
jgi:hypothetical protein